MGWSYETYYKREGGITKLFADKFNYQHDNGNSGKILLGALVERTQFYAAYEIINYSERKVIAICVMVAFNKNYNYNFGYKDMEETCGPYMFKCPEKILKLLTPTDNEYALKWREENWKVINKRKENINKYKSLFIGAVCNCNLLWDDKHTYIRIIEIERSKFYIKKYVRESKSFREIGRYYISKKHIGEYCLEIDPLLTMEFHALGLV